MEKGEWEPVADPCLQESSCAGVPSGEGVACLRGTVWCVRCSSAFLFISLQAVSLSNAEAHQLDMSRTDGRVETEAQVGLWVLS